MDTVGTTDTSTFDLATAPAADRLAVARAEHATAVENASEARDRAGRADAVHRQALANRQGYLDSASANEAVDSVDLTRASTAVGEARDAADLAASIAAGAGVRADKAHIATLAAEAAVIEGTYKSMEDEWVGTGTAVDAAWAVLQRAIDAHNATGLRVSIAANGARLFNHQTVPGAARTNKVLASQDEGGRPRANVVQGAVVVPIKAEFIDVSRGDVAIVRMTSVAQSVRNALGLSPLAPAPAAEAPAREYHGNVFGLVPAR
jgi:hypothetical protein